MNKLKVVVSVFAHSSLILAPTIGLLIKCKAESYTDAFMVWALVEIWAIWWIKSWVDGECHPLGLTKKDKMIEFQIIQTIRGFGLLGLIWLAIWATSP